ncbi:hypothetical protein [Roseomonas sp. KE2513]|uniref:hypothetical protein n=1 Tax=Roseomonas sp. KE2513 TaxID=2479202 RepID=UPI0018E05C06|nr:hypothetical protein [Roseomonas sp. KE2513]
MRTSHTHSLQISPLPCPGSGMVGITLCLGKWQQAAATGAWTPFDDVPTDQSEIAWRKKRQAVHAALDHGVAVLVHCKDGLGCAGLVPSRILVERHGATAGYRPRARQLPWRNQDAGAGTPRAQPERSSPD